MKHHQTASNSSVTSSPLSSFMELKRVKVFGGSDGKESSFNAGDSGLSQGQEDPLEKGMATHSSILTWRIPWTEPGGLQSRESQRVRHDWACTCTHTHTHTHTQVFFWIRIYFKGMLWLVWSSIQTTKTFHKSAIRLFHFLIFCVTRVSTFNILQELFSSI